MTLQEFRDSLKNENPPTQLALAGFGKAPAQTELDQEWEEIVESLLSEAAR